MLDSSASMQTDDAQGKSRWDAATACVVEAVEKAKHQDRLNVYAFDDSVRLVGKEDVDNLVPDGQNSRITQSGLELLAQAKQHNQPLKGIVLLSDGRQPEPDAPEPFALQAAARSIPVYPMVLGGEVPVRDLVVEASRRQHICFAGQSVSIQAMLSNQRMGPVQAELVLRDEANSVADRVSLFLTDDETRSGTFTLTPGKAGYYEYTVETDVRENEASGSNNKIGMGIYVLEDPLKVLLLEGEPYWDSKFLSHLLRGQTNMSVTAVSRIAANRYFKVSSENPLTATGVDTFPATDEEIAEYDVVVIGRGSEYMVTEERAYNLERFVSEHGGCIIFARGKSYSGSDSFLQDLEPVRWGKALNGSYRVKPLLSGEQAGLFGGALPGMDDPVWDALPPLERAMQCVGLKSFTSVLAEVYKVAHKVLGTELFRRMVINW